MPAEAGHRHGGHRGRVGLSPPGVAARGRQRGEEGARSGGGGSARRAFVRPTSGSGRFRGLWCPRVDFIDRGLGRLGMVHDVGRDARCVTCMTCVGHGVSVTVTVTVCACVKYVGGLRREW